MNTSPDPSVSLRQSEGFVVESGGGRVGVVEGLRYGTGSGIPDSLIVRAGRFARHRMIIGIDDIREIQPRQRRILLQPRWMTIRI